MLFSIVSYFRGLRGFVKKLSTWIAFVSFAGFCVFSVQVKSNVAKIEAIDAFKGSLSYGASPPAFELRNLDGVQHSLQEEVDGGKLVLVNFWATWCQPCRLEMPLLAKLHERYSADGLRIVAINVGEDPATVARFLTSRPAPFTILLDPESVVATRYRVEALPTTILLNDQGNIAGVEEGLDPYMSYRIESELEAAEPEDP